MATQAQLAVSAYIGVSCYDHRGASDQVVEDVELDSLWDDREYFLYNCSVNCLFKLTRDLKQYWISDKFSDISKIEEAAAYAIELFKLHHDNVITPISINRAYSCAFMQTLRVIMAMNVAGTRIQIEDGRLRGAIKDLNRIMRIIHGLHNILQSAYEVHTAWQGKDSSISSKLLELQRYTPINENKAGAKGLLIRHLCQRLAARRLRRCGSDVYEEIIVNGHHTHAWRRLCTIKEFIYKNCRREQDMEAWAHLQSQNNMELQLEKYFIDSNDIEFPELKRDRHIFSFRNGIYIGYQRPPTTPAKEEDRDPDVRYLDEGEPDLQPRSTFYYYTEIEDPESSLTLSDDVVAINYFDVDMPEDTLNACDPRFIPTPKFDQIFKDQDVPDDALMWVQILVGRLFYDLRELDDWEVLLFIKGVAGSGKSTLGRIIRRIYPAECVGHLSSNVQRKFALEGVWDKLIWICYEMKENWSDNIDQADLQSIISGGEEVVVNRKFQRPMHMVWTAPGLAIGNETGGWVDAKGSVTRRVVPVEFNNKIRNVDTRLFKSLGKEIPNIIVKCNRCYQVAVEAYVSEGVDIWEAMLETTKYFQDAQAKLRRETNSFADFLENHEKLERGDDKWIPYSELTQLYRDYCKQYNARAQKLTGDNFSTLCKEERLRYEEDQDVWIPYRNKSTSKIVHGIGYKTGQEPGALQTQSV